MQKTHREGFAAGPRPALGRNRRLRCCQKL